MLLLVIAAGFLERVLSRRSIEKFLATSHQEMLDGFRAIVATALLDQQLGRCVKSLRHVDSDVQDHVQKSGKPVSINDFNVLTRTISRVHIHCTLLKRSCWCPKPWPRWHGLFRNWAGAMERFATVEGPSLRP